MRILQVNTVLRGGGAEAVARSLHDEFRTRGHDAWIATGEPPTQEPLRQHTVALGTERAAPPWEDRLLALRDRVGGRAARVLALLANPGRLLHRQLGLEDFSYPSTREVLEPVAVEHDALHLHNLHGGYFDLRRLPALSARTPTVVTFHDQWLTTGHCAFSLDCGRWQAGCGRCPYLETYPAVRRDATAINWRRKQRILRRARFVHVAPSRWLTQRIADRFPWVPRSDIQVIPNGVDVTTTFQPDRDRARSDLGIQADEHVITFVANHASTSLYKDHACVLRAASWLGRKATQPLRVFVVGGVLDDVQTGRASITYTGYLDRPEDVARYYQAADVFMYATRADNHPLTVLEAMSCGVPVVATDVGGIREQVGSGADSAGALVPAGDHEALGHEVLGLLRHPNRRRKLATTARSRAVSEFSVTVMADRYLDLYREISDGPGAS